MYKSVFEIFAKGKNESDFFRRSAFGDALNSFKPFPGLKSEFKKGRFRSKARLMGFMVIEMIRPASLLY